jgi:hypothetical protein
MLIASLKDLNPVDHLSAFKQTSFPVSGPSDEFLAEAGYAKVNTWKPHTETQKLVSSTPYLENGWVYTVTVVNKTSEEIAAERNLRAVKIRKERNLKLSETDWTQLADAPVNREVWATYRQNLRDVPNQTGFPDTFNWPEPPTN